MWLKHLKMCVAAVGILILIPAGLLIRSTQKEKEPFTKMYYNLIELWEEVKTDVYGGG
jgi:hypothetical protein